MNEKLIYRTGFKIQTDEDLHYQTNIYPDEDIYYYRHGHLYISLNTEGYLIVYGGYASDLASGPTFNTKSVRRGAAIHDAIYELLRQELLDQKWRVPADHLLVEVIVIDGAYKWRAWGWFQALQWADGKAASPKNIKPILEAP